jgi:hypothetical protein
MLMKLLSLALVASVTLGGYAYAQTATPPASPSAPAASSSSGGKISHDCKKEEHKLCGRRTHGAEEQDCIKANLDLNKFSAACATEYKNAAAAKKPKS